MSTMPGRPAQHSSPTSPSILESPLTLACWGGGSVKQIAYSQVVSPYFGARTEMKLQSECLEINSTWEGNDYLSFHCRSM